MGLSLKNSGQILHDDNQHSLPQSLGPGTWAVLAQGGLSTHGAPVLPQPEPRLSLEPGLQSAGELSPPPWPLAPQGSQGEACATKVEESDSHHIPVPPSPQAGGKPEQPDAAG